MTIKVDIIAKNNSGSDVAIDDLGLIIDNSTQVSLNQLASLGEIYGSDELQSLVNAGTIVINDGSSDLSIADATEYLSPFNKSEIESETASAAQGALAETSIQPGDNNSALNNDSGFITSAPVDSVFGRTGTITAQGGDYTASQVTNAFDKAADNTDNITEGSTNFFYTETKFDASLSGKTTANLAEGSNLYFTDGRVDTRISATSIDALSDVDTTTSSPSSGDVLEWSGSNWVPAASSGGAVDSVNGQTGTVVLTTTNITEGANEYFTDARADARIAAASIDDLSDVDTSTSAPSTGDLLEWDGANWVPVAPSASNAQTFFQALKSGDQSTTTTMTDLTGWTVGANPSGDYSLDSGTGELTFNVAGYYSISYSALADQSANNRQELQIQLLVDKGSGYSVVSGSVDKQYASRNNAQDEGSAQVSNLVLQVAVGDKVKVQVAHVGVSGVIGSNDAKLSIFSLGTTVSGESTGFVVDYNDAGTSTTAVSLIADTWTDIPNDGAGAFTNTAFLPSGVTRLLDTSTGEIDPTDLNLGSSMLIRNDFTITPSINNATLDFRYTLGTGGSSYTLELPLGRLDRGVGIDYRFSLRVDKIYMGDTNTRNNPIGLQVKCSSNSSLVNAGTSITVVNN